MNEYVEYIASKDYYRRAVSSMDCYANATEYTFADGTARGLRAVEIRGGGGFQFTVLPDRGMDIAEACYKGIPVGYLSKMGIKNLPLCAAENNGEFGRYFAAGLLTTCGLDNVGSECVVLGKHFPQHGRHTFTPAETVCIHKYWEEGRYTIALTGTMRLASLFEENLLMKRTIKTTMGEKRVFIMDEITNESSKKQQYMLMYHCNFGFPIVSPDARVISNHRQIRYFDESSKQMGRNREELSVPNHAFKQSTHTLHQPATPIIKAAIVNPALGLGAYVECEERELPCFTQWVQLGEQDYVVGLEPGKNNPVGRKQAIEEQSIVEIQPGETQYAHVEIGVLEGEELSAYEKRIDRELKNMQ